MDRRQFVTQSVAHSVAALAAGRTALASRYTRTQRPPCNYRIAYNDDGHTLQHSSGLDDLLKKGVDCFIGTQVDALFWSVGHSDIYLFDTKTGEMFGQHVKQFDNASGVSPPQGPTERAERSPGLYPGHGGSSEGDWHPLLRFVSDE